MGLDSYKYIWKNLEQLLKNFKRSIIDGLRGERKWNHIKVITKEG